jgi:hypothetical protein
MNGFVMKNEQKGLSPEQREELLNVLKVRFEKNRNRHIDLEWNGVQAKLTANAEKLWSLNEMEKTGEWDYFPTKGKPQ